MLVSPKHWKRGPMIDRRTFLKQAGSLASAALVLPSMQKPRLTRLAWSSSQSTGT